MILICTYSTCKFHITLQKVYRQKNRLVVRKFIRRRLIQEEDGKCGGQVDKERGEVGERTIRKERTVDFCEVDEEEDEVGEKMIRERGEQIIEKRVKEKRL